MPNSGDKKMFALIVDANTGEPRRLIDTSDDPDDRILLAAEKVLAPDEVMHKLALEDYPVRRPYVIAQQLLGYVMPDLTPQIPSEIVAAKAKAAADIAPLLANLGNGFKTAFIAQAKSVLAGGKMPMNDTAVRNLLAAEMRRSGKDDIADKIRDDAPEAPFYISNVSQALLTDADVAVAISDAATKP